MPAYAIVRPQVEAGKVKVLAVTNHERAPAHSRHSDRGRSGLPVAAIRRAGRPIRSAGDCRRGTQQDRRPTCKEAAADPEIVEQMTATGQIVAPGDAAEFAASIEQQREQVAAVAKLFGNKPVQ